MSRCFPYPPPGYVRNGALIESIERERDKANTKQRKEKKREKKERKVKEEEEKIHDISDEKVKRFYDEKSHKREKRKDDLIGGYLSKERKDETEHLERSGLTEEHEQSQNLCYLSDGSQSSKKRKWHTSPSNGSQNHGNIIRIRLSLCKHKEPDVAFSEEQLCSTSGREEPIAQQKGAVLLPRQEQCVSIKTDTVKLTPEPNKELHCSHVAEIASLTKLSENQMKRAESQYKALIEDWVPPPLQFEQNDSDDLEWLFGAKQQSQQKRHGFKRLKADDDVSCHASATLWPRAQYLPEADIYALPYTIPF